MSRGEGRRLLASPTRPPRARASPRGGGGWHPALAAPETNRVPRVTYLRDEAGMGGRHEERVPPRPLGRHIPRPVAARRGARASPSRSASRRREARRECGDGRHAGAGRADRLDGGALDVIQCRVPSPAAARRAKEWTRCGVAPLGIRGCRPRVCTYTRRVRSRARRGGCTRRAARATAASRCGSRPSSAPAGRYSVCGVRSVGRGGRSRRSGRWPAASHRAMVWRLTPVRCLMASVESPSVASAVTCS